MSSIENHPTLRKARARAMAGGPPPGEPLTLESLKALAMACGADDCGVVRLDDPQLAGEAAYVTTAFPATRTLLALVRRMHREPVRSPKRSLANLEFHRAGDDVDEVARRVVRRLEDRGVRALNTAVAFPMEMDNFPDRGWIVSHKIVAQAAGLGRMGIHRSLIHPKFGSFVLLGTVLIAAELDAASDPLDFNPCLECKLCVAACPVGAIKPDGYFDFGTCYTHNYQQFMGGFANWIDDIADSKSSAAYDEKHSHAETASRWQSLSFGPNYNSAYCIAVCPAGDDVIGGYLKDKVQHRKDVLDPLLRRAETLYVVPGSDAQAYAAERFPHKTLKLVKAAGRPTSVKSFLAGIKLSFQPGRAAGLDATYHFTFTGAEPALATVIIRNRRLQVLEGHQEHASLHITADARTWIRFLNKKASLPACLLSGKVRLKGPPKLMMAFGKCFPS